MTLNKNESCSFNKTQITKKKIKANQRFKKLFEEEFDDPNEAFQEFLLSLIPSKKLLNTITKGKKYYYYNINRYL